MKIYLAGSVPKGDKEEKGFDDWRKRYKASIGDHFKANYVDPYERSKEFSEGDFMAVFAADCQHIKESELIIVYAENQLGVGTSCELAIAKYFGKLVITVLPKDSYHRRSNVDFRGHLVEDWIHPFIFAFSDIIIENIEEIKGYSSEKIRAITPKTISLIDESIKAFSLQ